MHRTGPAAALSGPDSVTSAAAAGDLAALARIQDQEQDLETGFAQRYNLDIFVTHLPLRID